MKTNTNHPALPTEEKKNNNGPAEPLRLGVVLMNLGGPTSEEAVKTFLYNLFTDPDIIKLGGGFWQRQLARLIVSRRAPKVAKKYKEINACPNGCTGNKHCENRKAKRVSDCCSPINPLTERQRRSLEKKLSAEVQADTVKVYTCMRYWLPDTETTLADLRADGINHVVLVPLYPQFSWTTTGSSLREWTDLRHENEAWQESIVKNYYQNPNFLAAVDTRISEALEKFAPADREKVQLVFSAHGTPMSEVRSGDPYTFEVARSVELVMARRGFRENYWHAFQSRVGPAKWTEPNTEDLVKRLLAYGARHLLLVPIAFVTDHIETLMELKIELLEEIEGTPFEQIEVTEGLNDHPLFIQSLADEVYRNLQPAYAHFLPEQWQYPSTAQNQPAEQSTATVMGMR